jgi:hypothetical protein
MAEPLSNNFTIPQPDGAVSEHHYTDLPPSSLDAVGHKAPIDWGKISTLGLIVTVVVFVASIGFVISAPSNKTVPSAKASSDSLRKTDIASVPSITMDLTSQIQSYPITFKGERIPDAVVADALKKFTDVPEVAKKNYIINRIVLYYAMKDALQGANVSFKDIDGTITFDKIENVLPELKATVDKNLLSTADYAFIKVFFNTMDNIDVATKELGDDLQPVALETINKYHKKLEDNPSDYLNIMDEANKDTTVQLLTNQEANVYIKDYYADLNNLPEQAPYIFEEEFDNILFKLPEGKVSDVITLNSIVPYMYLVVYPTRITTKQYQSLRNLISDKSSLFTY